MNGKAVFGSGRKVYVATLADLCGCKSRIPEQGSTHSYHTDSEPML